MMLLERRLATCFEFERLVKYHTLKYVSIFYRLVVFFFLLYDSNCIVC